MHGEGIEGGLYTPAGRVFGCAVSGDEREEREGNGVGVDCGRYEGCLACWLFREFHLSLCECKVAYTYPPSRNPTY